MLFDLHIHSIASKYKEGRGIVDNSTIQNAEVLMNKLEENKIGLFSITDHNRFYPELYVRMDELIASGKYPSVKGLLAGVEFDVILEENMKRCHIITIFNAENKKENYGKIYRVISNHQIDDKKAAYSKKEFEMILSEIDLDVILIACQRSGIDKSEGEHNSLSESTSNPEEFLFTGYINALEFRKPNVEGILKNNLKELGKNIGLVTGSDCHEWESYPKHDSKDQNNSCNFSRASILPTFKGLLMAVTSPETRINQQENRNKQYIQNIQIEGKTIPLSNGLVAIIGENGSGKSSILKILDGNITETYVKSIKSKYQIKPCNLNNGKKLYIGQGEIVKKFSEGALFSSENYEKVNDTDFKTMYRSYGEKIQEYIRARIEAEEAYERMKEERIEYDEIIDFKSYFINVMVDERYDEIRNIHAEKDRSIEAIVQAIQRMEEDEYYTEFTKEIQQISELLGRMKETIHERSENIEREKTVRNYIVSAYNTYKMKVSEASNSKQRDKDDFVERRQTFVSSIVNAIKKKTALGEYPTPPPVVLGCSRKPLYGFSFNSETRYNNKDVVGSFYEKVFTSSYRTPEAIQQIKSKDELKDAILRCTSVEKIEESIKSNISSFINEMCKTTQYIVDIAQSGETLGNTLGEMSLAYFKYTVDFEKDKNVFLIDQPEDHISNNNISTKMLQYFNKIRKKKQIILVTHNPLLVVNQDVDQVIFLKRINGKLEIVQGCLEYEDANTNMLELIADNMDGGVAAIEKRLKVYGKENCT